MDRLVLGEVVGPFVFSVLLFASLFFAGGDFMKILELLGRGVPPATAATLFLLTMPAIIAVTFPMAMLLATLLGFGRLSNDSEIVALVAGGASFGRIVVPVGVFAFGVTLVGLWFSDAVVPAANRGRQEIIRKVQQGVGTTGSVTAFDLSLREEGQLTTQIHVEGGVNVRTGTLGNVGITLWDKGEQVGWVAAEQAKWIVGTRNWELSDVKAALWPVKGRPAVFRGASLRTLENAIFGEGNLIELGTPAELAALERPLDQVSIQGLRQRVRLFEEGGSVDRAREAGVEIARRVAIPFASFVFALVGAPLGVRPQRAGKGVGFGLSILIIFSYWVALQFVSYLGRSGALTPSLAMALPNIFGVLAALYLIRRVLR